MADYPEMRWLRNLCLNDMDMGLFLSLGLGGGLLRLGFGCLGGWTVFEFENQG